MRCIHCLTRLSSLRVLEEGVAFVCERCDRTLSWDEVMHGGLRKAALLLISRLSGAR